MLDCVAERIESGVDIFQAKFVLILEKILRYSVKMRAFNEFDSFASLIFKMAVSSKFKLEWVILNCLLTKV